MEMKLYSVSVAYRVNGCVRVFAENETAARANVEQLLTYHDAAARIDHDGQAEILDFYITDVEQGDENLKNLVDSASVNSDLLGEDSE
jgi:hypothetical protein